MQSIKNAIIAAAGMGKRLGFDMPKPLIKICDKTLIEYQLEILKDVENVYIIVGFRAEEFINYVKTIRKDIIFVMNHEYASTNTMFSLNIALTYIKGPYVFMDGDVYFHREEARQFLSQAASASESIIGVTKAKSEDSVFVDIDDNGYVTQFTRKERKDYEWLGVGYFRDLSFSDIKKSSDVFSHLCEYLPLKSFVFDAYEIDTAQDLELAKKNIALF